MMVSRRPHRFVVSCEGGGGIDRRNLLMGLGGLYSAANLNSKSLALPIPPPDFNICVPSEAIRDGQPLMHVQCCPPISQTVTPYVLPEVTRMRLRKPAHTLDHYSIAQYRKAVQMMRDLDKSEPNDPRGFTQQANIHCAYCNGGDPEPPLNSNPKISVHYSWLFFPFHRWYLYFYERILGSLLGTSVPKNINDPDYLNSSFLFYDENKQLRSVTVADCIDYTKMGYDYQYSDITPWLNYIAPLKTKKATLENLSKRADEKVTFPLTLDETRRILVQKPAKGKADEVLVLENVDIDPTKLIKFNIFINEEDDDDPTNLDRAEYAGTFAQLIPHTHSVKTTKPSSINYSLKELYQVIGIGDDDQTVVVTLYPILNGEDVKIGGIKIIKGPSF
ncbi:hypothetical protein C2S51_007808 [Perilla frutescens var. frutescens]|nr:hypothetical protein C2S51_007808 [Perilla frutescens var. frutescens]